MEMRIETTERKYLILIYSEKIKKTIMGVVRLGP